VTPTTVHASDWKEMFRSFRAGEVENVAWRVIQAKLSAHKKARDVVSAAGETKTSNETRNDK
jgi:hypothetical protein